MVCDRSIKGSYVYPTTICCCYFKSTIELLTTGLCFPVRALSSRFLEVFETTCFHSSQTIKHRLQTTSHHLRTIPDALLYYLLNSVWLS